MLVKVLNFLFEGELNWDLVYDVHLSPVDDADVVKLEMNLLVQQDIFGRGSLVHDVDLSYHSDCPLLISVPFPC